MSGRGGRKTWVGIGIVVLVFLASDLFAGPVDLSQVQKVTNGFLEVKTAQAAQGPGAITVQSAAPAPGGFRELRDDDGTLLAYIADLEPHGFIALAANTDLEPVIAYSFRTSFPDGTDKKNPLYRMLREDMRLRAKALAEHPELKTRRAGELWALYADGKASISAAAFQQWPPEGSTSTGGWLETAWTQDAPYNQFCPADTVDGGRSYTGCAATAIAQILNYHRQCNVVFDANDAYRMSNGMRIDGDSALYDYPSFTALNTQVQAVQAAYAAGAKLNDAQSATLSFACGVAMKMDYSSEGSGASPFAAGDAVRKKFGFYQADMFGGLAAEACLVLQENVLNRRPAMIGMRPPDGFGGHGVVCDGYNTEGEYHFNFGWGPQYPEKITEVWYRLPTDFYPNDFVITESVLNIQPQEPALKTDPVSLSFYSSPGQESDPQILRLQNSVAGVQVDSIVSPDGFVIATADTFASQVPAFTMASARETTSLRVKFHPSQAGGYYGTLAIHYNNGNVRYVILRGWSFAGGTQIAGGSVSGTWTQDKSPYFVNEAIQVAENAELVIEPGVKVFFTGPFGLTVGKRAKLTAKGSATQPVEFTAWDREAGWGGLRFLSSGSDDVLSYCSITWAKKTAGFLPDESSDDPGPTTVDSYGGAIFCGSSGPKIDNCRITNNLGDMGGAIYSIGGYPIITNTLIANNTSLGGTPRCGGVCINVYGAAELRNCTIVNNSPGGLFAASWDGLSMTNTIVWGNEMYQIQTDQSDPTVTFCDVQGGFRGAGNRDADPGFLGPSAGPGIEYDGSAANWALQSVSPCINAGTQVQDLPATDLAGALRIASAVIDLGAWENQSELPLLTISPSVTADAGFVPLNTSSSIHLDLTNTGAQDFKIQSLSITEGDKTFSLLTPMADRIVAPGTSVPVEIAFKPTREMIYRGKLDVRSAASNAGRVQIALKGVGVSGTIVPAGAVSGIWSKAASPYVVTGDIQIPRGKTLTIEPGVTVKFAGHFRFTVGYRGTLRAIGTEQDRILFTASDKKEGWYGIRLVNTAADDTLQYCTLEYAKKPYATGGGVLDLYGGAILCYSSWDDDPGFPLASSPRIESCRLTHNHALTGGAIACLEGAKAVIVKNTILDNTADYYGAGIAVYNAEGTIANNVIARNAAQVEGGGLKNIVSNPTITNNTFVANRPSALQLDPGTDKNGHVWTTVITNNIIWKNEISQSDAVQPEEYQIRFNDIQGGWEGEGNLDKDPCFANLEADDYHLKSQAGRWDPATQTWVVDALTSPCIDVGDPASNIGQEPQPNGGRINLGADGGTDQASKSPGS